MPTPHRTRAHRPSPRPLRAWAAAFALASVATATVALFASPARAEADDEPAADESAPPAPKVTLGSPRTVRGALPPKGVERALHAIAPAVEACYRSSIAEGQDADGSLELRMELVAPGKVASVVVNASRGVSAPLRGCVRDAFVGVAAGGVGPEPIEVLLAIDFDREAPLDFSLPASACPATCDGEIDDALKAELRARALQASHCFKRAAAPGEPVTLKAGELQVTLRVASDGSVCGVATGGDAFRPSLTSCVVEAMGERYVAAPDGCLDVTVPLAFKGT